MTTILNKLKSIGFGIVLLSFVLGIGLNACTGNKKTEKSENIEATSETDEHPASEHPSGDEHPSGGEHPSSDEEHPSDSTQQEHPNN